MLAKLIVWAPAREAAIDRMKRALDDFVLLGVGTNIEFLRRAITTADFTIGSLDTAFLDRHPELFNPPQDIPIEAILAASVTLPPSRDGERAPAAASDGSGPTFSDAWTSGPWRNS